MRIKEGTFTGFSDTEDKTWYIPQKFVPGSGEKAWWLCSKCGNEWQSIIVNRIKGHGCDICATERRKISKKETLLSARGSIDKEWCLLDWDYEEKRQGMQQV